MKLIYRIFWRLSVALVILLSIWGILFYVAILDELNDEMDDALEDYSEFVILRSLSGKALPDRSDGTNNSYYLAEISEEYARQHEHVRYSDEMVYVPEKKETEPARILRTIFKNAEDRHFELTVSIPTIEKDDLQEAVRDWIITLYITLLLVILVVNVWVYYRSMSPLYVLLKWLDQYTIGKNIPIPESKTRVTEFRKLHEAAVRSMERNESVFEQQKQFIGNASHEIQTPLAVCLNRLEMLMNDEEFTEVQLEEMAKMYSTLEHIVRLNKALLLLYKIDNGQFQESQEVSFNSLIGQQQENFEQAYAFRHISWKLQEEGEAKLKMNITLATILVSNLLKNAYLHNCENGKIEVRISAQGILIGNTGQEEALDEKRIFERFYQGKSKKEGSTGLGLSIVNSVCRFYHFHIRYFYQHRMHFFEIRF